MVGPEVKVFVVFSDLVKAYHLKTKLAWQAGSFPLAPPGKPKHGSSRQTVASRDCLLLLKGRCYSTCLTVFRTIEAHRATLSGLSSRVWQNLFKARNVDRHISALSPIPRLSPLSCLSLLEHFEPRKLLPFWNLFTGNQF